MMNVGERVLAEFIGAYLFLVTEGEVGSGLGGGHTLSRFGSSGVGCGWVVE